MQKRLASVSCLRERTCFSELSLSSVFLTFVGVHKQVGVTQPIVKDPARPPARSTRSLEVTIPRYQGSKVRIRDLVLRVAACVGLR